MREGTKQRVAEEKSRGRDRSVGGRWVVGGPGWARARQLLARLFDEIVRGSHWARGAAVED